MTFLWRLWIICKFVIQRNRKSISGIGWMTGLFGISSFSIFLKFVFQIPQSRANNKTFHFHTKDRVIKINLKHKHKFQHLARDSAPWPPQKKTSICQKKIQEKTAKIIISNFYNPFTLENCFLTRETVKNILNFFLFIYFFVFLEKKMFCL